MKILPKLIAGLLAMLMLTSAHAKINETIYDKCVNSQNTFNNSVVLSCADQASYAYKKNITQSYNKIYANLKRNDIDNAKKFEQSQIAWIEYRNKYCELTGWYIGTPMYGLCPMELNLQRAMQLQEMAENF